MLRARAVSVICLVARGRGGESELARAIGLGCRLFFRGIRHHIDMCRLGKCIEDLFCGNVFWTNYFLNRKNIACIRIIKRLSSNLDN